MTSIKLVLTDIDGTVVPQFTDKVSPAVHNAVVAAEAQGVEVVPVTGRPFEMAQPAMKILGFDDLCIVDNGATIRKIQTGALVWSKWLEPEKVKQLVDILLPYARSIMDYSDTWNEIDPAEADPTVIDWSAPYVFCGIPKEYVDEILQKLTYVPDIEVGVDRGWNRIAGLFGMQITHKAADKFHGVEQLRKIMGIAMENTMAIGDGDNDLSLFKNAGLKVAMGNATDRLKAAADHVVARVEDDGFAEAMQRYVLD